MADDILLIREKNVLAACDAIGDDFIKAMRHGEQVLATIKRARHPQHHRKMFALLNLVLENQEKYKNIRQLLSAVKVGVKHCDYMEMTVDGVCILVAIPKSISFANMPQDEFEDFYNSVIDYIIEEVIPDLDRGDLERQVMEFL